MYTILKVSSHFSFCLLTLCYTTEIPKCRSPKQSLKNWHIATTITLLLLCFRFCNTTGHLLFIWSVSHHSWFKNYTQKTKVVPAVQPHFKMTRAQTFDNKFFADSPKLARLKLNFQIPIVFPYKISIWIFFNL